MPAEFKDYHYIEWSVKALPLIPANVAAIIKALTEDAAKKIIGSLQIQWPPDASVPTIVFRYLNQTTDYALTEGEYLVIITNTSRKFVLSSSDFLSAYAPGDHTEPEPGKKPIVGTGVVGEVVLP